MFFVSHLQHFSPTTAESMPKFVLVCTTLLVCGLIESGFGFGLRSRYMRSSEAANENLGDVDLADEQSASTDPNALFLTPYIEAGKLAEGRNLSEVKNLPLTGQQQNIQSFAGYLTVNKTYESNLFFWFFPPLSGKVDKNTPILLWLQGGPGASSLFGLFVENGPLKVKSDSKHAFVQGNYSWNTDYAVIYIDQPVGTGFSFTNDDKGYVKDEVEVARDLYEALKQFFTLYEDYRGNPFYVTGESYGGKYIPAIGYKIHKEGANAQKIGINLQGLAIGDGWTDPRNMLDYGDYLYQVGLIDELQRDHFYEQQALVAAHIDDKQYLKAFLVMDALMDGDLTPDNSSYFRNVTGMKDYFNILYQEMPEDTDWYNGYLALAQVRAAIHVGNKPYNDGSIVEKHMMEDVFATVAPWVEELLNADVRILFYSGQLDVIVAAPLTENFLRLMSWKRSREFNSSPRKIYRTKENPKLVAGYARHEANICYVVIRNSGHMVPYDQPQIAYDLITRFVQNQSFD